MAIQLNPYLNFRGDARQAMEFYQSVFGGELNRSTFGDLGMSQDPADSEKTMHSELRADNGLVLMASDTPNYMDYAPGTNNFSVSLSGDDEATLRGYWDKLSDGGTVGMPLGKAPWGDTFGMCVDRFGISWLINIAGS